jgi:homoserine kinase
MIKLKVPATSANLGPGFDTLGLALGLYNTFTFEVTGDRLEIIGCPSEFTGAENLAVLAFDAVLREAGKRRGGLRVNIQADIPISRGLGSSAALLTAGAAAANELYNCGMDKKQLLSICGRIEGHADNLASAFYGGLNAVLMKDGEPVTARFAINESLRFNVLIPDFKVSTKEARAVLPEMIPFGDAVFNISRALMLIKAFETGDTELLRHVCEDRLHEPDRKALIPGYELVREAAMASGASGIMISGSGSSLLCVSGLDISQPLTDNLSSLSGGWRVITLKADANGVSTY